MRNDLAQDLGVEAVALRLGIDFLDVAGDRLLLLLEPLDALDEALELALGEAGFLYPAWQTPQCLCLVSSGFDRGRLWYFDFQSS